MSSYRTNNAAPTYDHALLSYVPDRTGAAIPEEYDVDLLAVLGPTTLGYIPGAVGNARKEDSASGHEPVAKKAPWYRTRWGIGVIILIIMIITIIGGVVADTHRHHSRNDVEGQLQPGLSQSQAHPSPNTTQGSSSSTFVSTTTEAPSSSTNFVREASIGVMEA